MNRLVYISFCIGMLLPAGCDRMDDQDTEPDGLSRQWHKLGLGDQVVNQIQFSDPYLLAATGEGFYRKNVHSDDTLWTVRGLAGKRVLDFIVFSENEMLACVEANSPDEQVSVYYTTSGGAQWQAYQNGFGGQSGQATCHALEKDPANPDVLYARAAAATAKSTDRGKSWQLVEGQWDGIGYQSPLIEVNPFFPNMVWSGGENAIFQPYLLKSSDRGQTWLPVNVPSQGDNAVYSVLNHPTDSTRVLVGMEGQIVYSADGWRQWQQVLSPESYPYFLAMAHHPDGNRLYATGSDNGTAGGNLFFYYSQDFGQNWQRVNFSEGSSGNAANALVVRTEGDKPGLYFGTQQGVFRYSGFE